VAPGEHLRADVSHRDCARRIEAEFVFPISTTRRWNRWLAMDLKDNRCDIYTASQMPGGRCDGDAKSTGLAPERVHIHVLDGRRRLRPRGADLDYLLESVAVQGVAAPPALAGEGPELARTTCTPATTGCSPCTALRSLDSTARCWVGPPHRQPEHPDRHAVRSVRRS
jgi:hypothetical protein